jgi:hypothetical protein
MIDSAQLANRMSTHIEKNLRGNTPFQSTSDFIAYIAYKESQKKFNNAKHLQ